ncbi:SRPBCC family protein [Lyngbya confervoides]|uniref:SRPBCC family protein n=1 Tax=Lyngbya confervoides BDU141951 TaxID=1574623 RepID=A0ABD4SZ65_9CYAN|nr:SRPBCC family protein [Lyngbya confervoides]MCM1981684.1 SRPBCC family protein [Lyngbya confervoides BDU141951]
MLHFEKTSWIDAAPPVVWRFYERPDILTLITPPWQPVEVVRREGGLGVGAESEFRIWLGPIPVTWVAVHTHCQAPDRFVDVQKSGPMEFWQHQHFFIAERGGTTLVDKIDFSLPGGDMAEFLLGGWIKERLSDMFDYRHQVTREACAGKM